MGMNQYLLLNRLRDFDWFGSQIPLRFQKRDQNRTLFGAIYSIFIQVSMVFFIYFYGLEVLERQNPIMIQEQLPVGSTDLVNLTLDNFDISFEFDTISNNSKDPENYFNIQAFFRQKFSSQSLPNDQILIPLETIKCPQNSQQYCLSQESYKQINIKPQTDQEHFDVQILFTRCIEENDRTCASIQQIDNLMENSNLRIHMLDVIFDVKDQSKPFHKVKRTDETPSSIKQKKSNSIYLKAISMKNDRGTFIQEISYINDFQISRDEVNIHYMKSENEPFHEVFIKYDGKLKETYQRNYKKLQTFLAQIGGVFQFFLIIGRYLCTQIAVLDMKKKLVNHFFKFKNKNTDQYLSEADFKTLQLDPIVRVRQTSTSMPIQLMGGMGAKGGGNGNGTVTGAGAGVGGALNSPVYTQKKLAKVISSRLILEDSKIIGSQIAEGENTESYKKKNLFKSVFDLSKQVLRIKGCEYLLFLICPCLERIQKKRKVLQYSYERLMYRMDSVAIMRKLLEIDQLKMLVLNKDQQNLFQYMPYPTIHADLIIDQDQESTNQEKCQNMKDEAEQMINLFFFEKKSNLEQAQDAYNSLQTLKLKKNFTEIDNKLVSFLDPMILKFFKEKQSEIKRLINNGLSEKQIVQSQIFTPQNKSKLKASSFANFQMENSKIDEEDQPENYQQQESIKNSLRISYQGEENLILDDDVIKLQFPTPRYQFFQTQKKMQ